MNTETEGWALPHGARVYHYFIDIKSLCRDWVRPSRELIANDAMLKTQRRCKQCEQLFAQRVLFCELRGDDNA